MKFEKKLQVLADYILSDNSIPLDSFEGYTAKELMQILGKPFTPGSVLTLNKLPDEEILKVPIVSSALFLLREIKDSGNRMELGPIETLPTEIAKKLLNHSDLKVLPQEVLDPGEEHNTLVVDCVYSACLSSGLIDIVDEFVSLSALGEAALTDLNALLDSIVNAFLSIDFWYYFDDIQEDISFTKYGYVFMLLHRYGASIKDITFYINHFKLIILQAITNNKAVLSEDELTAFIFRVFNTMLPLLGIANIVRDKGGFPLKVYTNELFRKMISCKQPNKSHKLKTDFSALGLQ